MLSAVGISNFRGAESEKRTPPVCSIHNHIGRLRAAYTDYISGEAKLDGMKIHSEYFSKLNEGLLNSAEAAGVRRTDRRVEAPIDFQLPEGFTKGAITIAPDEQGSEMKFTSTLTYENRPDLPVLRYETDENYLEHAGEVIYKMGMVAMLPERTLHDISVNSSPLILIIDSCIKKVPGSYLGPRHESVQFIKLLWNAEKSHIDIIDMPYMPHEGSIKDSSQIYFILEEKLPPKV